MTLVSTLYAPQESVNDQFLSLISVLVKTGDFVKTDTLIAELETSKAVVEVRAENDGYIKVFVAANTDVKIGTKMFEFYDAPIEAAAAVNLVSEVAEDKTEKAIIQKTVFSNAAEQYIKEHGINKEDYATLKFVTKKDLLPKEVLHTATPSETAALKTRETNLSDKSIKPIAKSKKTEFEYLHSVNSSSVISRLSTSIQISNKEIIGKSQQFIKSTPLPSVIQEVSKLLLKYPNLNSFYLNGDQAFYNTVNVGFALDDGKNGLKVASILNSNDLTLSAIEESIADLSLKYSNKQLGVSELTSATFTITDLFNSNVISFHPLVNNNNSCILGISSFKNGEFIIDLSFDHRLTSGKEVSQFLEDLKFRLEARFKSNKTQDDNAASSDIQCVKCFRHVNDDADGTIFFQKIINSKLSGYICSNCLIGW